MIPVVYLQCGHKMLANCQWKVLVTTRGVPGTQRFKETLAAEKIAFSAGTRSILQTYKRNVLVDVVSNDISCSICSSGIQFVYCSQ